MSDLLNSLLSPASTTGAFVFQDGITVAADFPTALAVQNGWVYTIDANVTDNDATKTNTGQSFLIGDVIAWNGTDWTDITGLEVWLDDGTNLVPVTAGRNADVGTGFLKGDSLKINDTDDSNTLNVVFNENDSADRTLNLGVGGGDRSLTLNENLTIGDGNNVLITAEDNDLAIVLDNANLEVENANATERSMKLIHGTDANATLTIEGANSVINQDVTSDATVTHSTLDLTGTGDTLILGATTDAATPRVSMKIRNSGYGPPSAANSDSNGDKSVFWNSAVFKAAWGMDANEMWWQAMGTAGSDRFRWYTGDATTPQEAFRLGETEIIFNESRTDRDFKIAQSGSGYAYTYDFGTEEHIFSPGRDGVIEGTNASDVSKYKLNSVGPGYHINNFGSGTKVPIAQIDNAGSEAKKVRTIAAATGTIAITDNIIVVDYTTTGTVALDLPSATTAWNSTDNTGIVFTIMDKDANAGTNAITINRDSSDTIIDTAAAQTSTTIAANGGVIHIMAISATEWKVF